MFYSYSGTPIQIEDIKSSSTQVTQSYRGEITDLSYLKELTGNSDEKMKKYVGIYLQQTPRNLEELEQAIDREDVKTVSRVVHTMKPHLAYMGMDATSELVLKIEGELKESSDLDSSRPYLDKLNEDCRKSVEELRRYQ